MRDSRLHYPLFFMLLTILIGCGQNSQKEPSSRTEEKKEAALISAENRRMMPDFSLTALQDGFPVNSKDFLGRITVVAFFSPWCSDCVSEMGMLEKLQTSPLGAEFSAVGMAGGRPGR
jgi:thiol-disulfide isomerase/thioredoxin